MKKFFRNYDLFLAVLCFSALIGVVSTETGCSTTTTLAGPSGTTTNTVVKGIDPVTEAAINGVLSNIVASAPGVIADIAAVKALVSNAPPVTVVVTNK